MKTLRVGSKDVTLRKALTEAVAEGAVILADAELRFVLAVADEADIEVLAMQSSPEFMAHLADLVERARKGPHKSLAQVREELAAEP